MDDGHACESSQDHGKNHEVLLETDVCLIKYLNYNHPKSVFTWSGSFDDLKSFCSEHLEVNLTTCSINHNERSKSIKSNSLTVVLFNTGTLQLQGSSTKTVKDKLNSILNLKDGDDGKESDSDDSDDEDEELEILKNQISELKGDISFVKNLILNERKDDSSSNEKQALKQENDSLREIINIQKEEISQLKTSNQSLLRVISLLSSNGPVNPYPLSTDSLNQTNNESDSNFHNRNPSPNQNNSSNQNNSQEVKKKNKSRKKTNSGVVQSEATGNTTEPINDYANTVSQNQTNTSTVIVGDSIVKNIQGFKLGKTTKSRVIVKAFPGATTADMYHYVKPTLEKNPERIIMHAGTNDLRLHEPEKVADKIVDLAKNIASQSGCEILISELTTRSQSNDKVKTVNRLLSKFCNRNRWTLIRHNNINESHLNKGGLHLNQQGTTILFNNFAKHLKRDN